MEKDAEAPAPGAPTPPSPQLLRRLSTVLYVVLGGGGLLWIRLRTGNWLPESFPGREPVVSLTLGLSLAVLVVAASTALLRFSPLMRWFAGEIRRLIGRPDFHTAAHVAIVSSIGEEVLFRGAIQPVLGFVGTSILFGAMHVGPDRRYLGWTVFAIAMGFALGGIYEYTGSLLGPIAAHAVINFLNLLRIGRIDPGEPEDPAVRAALGTDDAEVSAPEYNAEEPG